MKIKRSFYCIVDKNNKPDFRFLFENQQDAWSKIKQIKNSTRGETLFIGENKKEFFAQGIKKSFISPVKRIRIKKGCWSALKTSPLKMLEDIAPAYLFDRTIRAEENRLYYSKQKENEISFQNSDVKLPVLPNPLSGVDWDKSFLKTRSFVGTLAVLCVATVLSVFFIHQSTTEKITRQLISEQNKIAQKNAELQTKVLGKKDEQLAQQFDSELTTFVTEAMKTFENIKQEELEQEVRKILAGYPMEKMAPYIAQNDRIVAAFLVGIAKKESNFGLRVPLLNGQDCYNYWGYRGIREKMGTGGHTCFDSPEDAVKTVAGRLRDLVQADVKTPEEMVLWKCGSSCATHSPESVRKWISDVNIYFSKINDKENPS